MLRKVEQDYRSKLAFAALIGDGVGNTSVEPSHAVENRRKRHHTMSLRPCWAETLTPFNCHRKSAAFHQPPPLPTPSLAPPSAAIIAYWFDFPGAAIYDAKMTPLDTEAIGTSSPPRSCTTPAVTPSAATSSTPLETPSDGRQDGLAGRRLAHRLRAFANAHRVRPGKDLARLVPGKPEPWRMTAVLIGKTVGPKLVSGDLDPVLRNPKFADRETRRATAFFGEYLKAMTKGRLQLEMRVVSLSNWNVPHFKEGDSFVLAVEAALPPDVPARRTAGG